MTGLELITEIAICSSRIADLTRFITSHPTAPNTTKAEVTRVQLEEQREVLRKRLDEEPDLTFS